MRKFVLLLSLLGSLLIPGAVQPVRGQTSKGACLEPEPRPLKHRLPSPGGPVAGESRENPPALFVSPQGKLCQIFDFRGMDETEPQVALDRAPEPGKAFLFSAVIPGTGQWLLGQDRWPAYLAVEVWAWVEFLNWRREGHSLQTEYKDLAWLVARRISTGPRIDAGWEYYEALTHFQSSGAYDSDPLRTGVQPEADPTTFNGSIWALAQQIYFPEDPENPVPEGSESYERAFDYYLSRAYTPRLAWDWSNHTLHQEEYTGLIKEADEALRSSTGMIGVILANHLLSAVDALVSGRLGVAGKAEPSIQVHLTPGPFNTGAITLQVRLITPDS